jgi:TP901 family phage tail tape measure protein
VADRVVKYVFRGDISGLKSSLTAAGAGVKDLGNKLTAAGKDGDKFRTGLTSVGGAAGKVGLVAAAGLGAMVAATANFDKAMSGVKAATHETAANMELMRAAAIKAGADTAFSASEAADGIEQLAKAGVATKDILGGGLDGALSLAAAGSMEVGDAAEVAATALTQFKLQGKDIPHVADLLAAAAGKAQGEVSDMGMALKQGGLVAAQMGLSIEETTGTLAAFASAGLLGSDAGTSLKTMLLKLANPSSQAAGLMQQLGINAYDASGNLVSMSNLAGQLQTAFKGQSQATRDAAMATIFGSDAIRASSILYSQGSKGITDWTNKVNDQGFAAETAALKLDNLSGDLEKLKGSLETALIGSGEGSQGMLRGLVQGADSLVNAFNNLPGPAKNVATAFTAITAVTGGGLWFSAKAIGGIANMRQALADLGPTGTKAAAALRGVGLAAGGLIALQGVVQVASAIGDSFLNAYPGVERLTKSLLDLQATGAGGDLAKKYADIGDSIRYLGDPNLAENIQSTILKVISLGTASDSFEVKQAKREIDSLDAAFANLVTSGSPDLAAAALDKFAASTNLSSGQRKELLGLMPQYQEALAGVGNAEALAGDKAAGAVAGVDGLTGAMKAAATESFTLKNAMDILFGRVDVDAALVSWQRGIQGLGKDLKGGAHALDVMTTKGQDNRDKIRGQVEALRTWAEAQHEVDGSTKGLTRRLLEGRAEIIRQGKAAGISRGQMQHYLHALGLTPKQIRTDVALIGTPKATGQINGVVVKLNHLDRIRATATMDARDLASADIARVRAGLASLHDKTIVIRAIHTESRLGPIRQATGGPISGPGTATSDSIPAYLSNGEYVIKAAAVDKYGTAMFDRLNAMAFANGGPVQRFATGGKATAQQKFDLDGGMTARGVIREFEALAKALGHFGKHLHSLEADAVRLSKAYNREEKRLHNLQSKANDLRSSAAGSFNNDPFGGGASGLMLQLKADANDARGMTKDLRILKRKGISSGLAAALAASGDLDTANQLAQMSRGKINQFDAAYASRAQAQRTLGNTAANVAFGKQIRHLSTVLSHLDRRIEGIERAAERGTRKGISERDKKAVHKRRAHRGGHK